MIDALVDHLGAGSARPGAVQACPAEIVEFGMRKGGFARRESLVVIRLTIRAPCARGMALRRQWCRGEFRDRRVAAETGLGKDCSARRRSPGRSCRHSTRFSWCARCRRSQQHDIREGAADVYTGAIAGGHRVYSAARRRAVSQGSSRWTFGTSRQPRARRISSRRRTVGGIDRPCREVDDDTVVGQRLLATAARCGRRAAPQPDRAPADRPSRRRRPGSTTPPCLIVMVSLDGSRRFSPSGSSRFSDGARQGLPP